MVGGGGREHALVRALARSPRRPELLCAPGNAGIRRDARLLDAPADDPAALAAAARDAGVDLVVVGPEAPLVAGLADALPEAGVRRFGPVAAAARLEGSKAFAKEIMAAAARPHRRRTASSGTADDGLAAIAGYPAVVKADGLAAGKGVVIAADETEARGRARGDARRAPLRRHAGGRRGVPRGRRALAPRARATASARSRSRPRATTSGSATATPARTPAAWALLPRAPARDDARTRRHRDASTSRWSTRSRAAGRRSAACSTPGSCSTARRPEGARVQRPLRRPRDAGRAAAAALRPARAPARRDRARRARGRGARLGSARRGLRRPRLARLPRRARPPAT